MAKAKMIVCIEVDIPESNSTGSSLEVINIERNRVDRAIIRRGLKRTVQIFNCLSNYGRLIDRKIFTSNMNFEGVSFFIEHNVGGNWERNKVNFTKSFEGDGYEIV